MIDWVKLEIPKSYWNSLRRLEVYDAESCKFDKNDYGEFVIDKKKFGCMTFSFYKNRRITLDGSLHKFHNNGVHNANDFTRSDLIRVLNELKKVFDLRWEDCIVLNYEFGVNIIPIVPSFKVLQGCFMYRRKKFSSTENGAFNYVELQRYKLKIYNKKELMRLQGQELEHSSELLRVEIKTKKRAKDFGGIERASDFLKEGIFKSLEASLVSAFNSIVFYDVTIQKELCYLYNKRTSIDKISNPLNWIDRATMASYDEKAKERTTKRQTRWGKLLEMYSIEYGSDLQSNIEMLISSKCRLLNK